MISLKKMPQSTITMVGARLLQNGFLCNQALKRESPIMAAGGMSLVGRLALVTGKS